MLYSKNSFGIFEKRLHTDILRTEMLAFGSFLKSYSNRIPDNMLQTTIVRSQNDGFSPAYVRREAWCNQMWQPYQEQTMLM